MRQAADYRPNRRQTARLKWIYVSITCFVARDAVTFFQNTTANKALKKQQQIFMALFDFFTLWYKAYIAMHHPPYEN